MGYTVEEWLVETSGSVTAYILMQGQCQKQNVPMPELGCTGWTQDSSGLWRQSCKPKDLPGAVELVVSVVNGQPAYVRINFTFCAAFFFRSFNSVLLFAACSRA